MHPKEHRGSSVCKEDPNLFLPHFPHPITGVLPSAAHSELYHEAPWQLREPQKPLGDMSPDPAPQRQLSPQGSEESPIARAPWERLFGLPHSLSPWARPPEEWLSQGLGEPQLAAGETGGPGCRLGHLCGERDSRTSYWIVGTWKTSCQGICIVHLCPCLCVREFVLEARPKQRFWQLICPGASTSRDRIFREQWLSMLYTQTHYILPIKRWKSWAAREGNRMWHCCCSNTKCGSVQLAMYIMYIVCVSAH